MQLMATGLTAAGGYIIGRAATWTSGTPAVVSVSMDGLLHAVDTGTATITATIEGKSAAAAITVGLVLTNLTAGGGHACGVTAPAGTGYCWGNNVAGALGNGATTPTLSSSAVAVSGGLRFSAITGGGGYSCGLTISGVAYCWGFNDAGQLGNGSMTNTASPVTVVSPGKFAQISAGDAHTCAVSTDGRAFCWGRNDEGQLGDGTTMNRLVPVAVSGDHRFTTVSAGVSHSCGTAIDGGAYCWGENFYGDLGTGTAGSGSSVPVAVTGGIAFSGISASSSFTCGVATDGTGYCWGRSDLFQLGSPAGPYYSDVPVAVAGGHTFASISAGFTHSCGVTTSGAAYCWGAGWLGNGTTTESVNPVLVSGGLIFATVSVSLSYTTYYACGVTTTHAAHCWGTNGNGELGTGDYTPRSVPVQVLYMNGAPTQ